MITYHTPPDVLSGLLKNRPLLSTSQGGHVALDKRLLTLWQSADGCDLNEVINNFQEKDIDPEEIKAGLACLAEAGLLLRSEESPPVSSPNSSSDEMVSVVIVNYNSLNWLKECLPSLSTQTHQPLEVIVVDNASSDTSLDWLGKNHPEIKMVRLEQSHGLAYAINRGIELAEGDYFLILNPDVSLQADAVAEMVLIARGDPSCAAVAAKLMFWWAPAFINGIGNRVGAAFWGTDNALGHLDLGQFDSWHEVPSVCFAAALIPRSVWASVGPTDESFPLYYEDSEWSYRARLLGYTIRAAPKAVVYHAFGRRVHTGEHVDLTPAKLRNVVYGRLRFAVKIIPSLLTMYRFILSYWLEDAARILLAIAKLDRKIVGSVLGGWREFLVNLPLIREERRFLQTQRQRPMINLFSLQRNITPPFIWRGLPELTWDLVRNHYLPMIKSGSTRALLEFSEDSHRPRLLIVSHDVVGEKLAGTGMRYLELARALKKNLDVTLAMPNETDLEESGISLEPYRLENAKSLRPLVDSCDVILISSFILQKFPYLEEAKARIIVDLYDPLVLENLHYYKGESRALQENLNDLTVNLMNRLVSLGDFFICANERQRDFWIGVLAANGRVNPQVFAQDATLRSLIDIVGIGIPERELNHRPMLRDVNPAFPAGSRIVLWGGGIWDWLDPLSLVQAWPRVLDQHPLARLVFLGTRHPNPLVPRHKIVEEVETLVKEIGEKDKTIFFYEWLPYEERESLLSEADVGVALHPLHIETRYSMRTRVLDYIWAQIPILVSDGDVTSDWVNQYKLGRVVPPLDVDAVADALNDILSVPKPTWSPQFEAIRDELAWSRVVEPLRNYCLLGEPAPDRERSHKKMEDYGSGVTFRGLLARAWYIWRSEKFAGLSHRVWRYIQWRLS